MRLAIDVSWNAELWPEREQQRNELLRVPQSRPETRPEGLNLPSSRFNPGCKGAGYFRCSARSPSIRMAHALGPPS